MGTKTVYPRSVAQQALIDTFDPDYCECTGWEFALCVKGLTNEELEAEMCLSGIVHDEDMGGVVDD